jgi:hypothetical protein
VTVCGCICIRVFATGWVYMQGGCMCRVGVYRPSVCNRMGVYASKHLQQVWVYMRLNVCNRTDTTYIHECLLILMEAKLPVLEYFVPGLAFCQPCLNTFQAFLDAIHAASLRFCVLLLLPGMLVEVCNKVCQVIKNVTTPRLQFTSTIKIPPPFMCQCGVQCCLISVPFRSHVFASAL